MMVFKRKQVVVLSLILMIVVAGYLQYSYNKSSVSVNEWDDVSVGDSYENVTIDETEENDVRLGEAVYVDRDLMGDDIEAKKEDEEEDKDDKQEALKASQDTNNFFAQAKINREITRSRDKDVLKEISEDVGSSEELKKNAQELMMKIIGNSEKEMRVETLIKEKGFNDVVVLFGSDGSVDVIVKTPSLTSVQVAQIADITSRHAEVDIQDIYVRPKF
ncbi:SpoIIIAH-like family protein [Herbivorax sp. ANBcel31]|uniref:SpoIIIAH-like family protein n=1 Tax=Herbivorax sp. ANBcel31 TaxID=3069754 RepID=UPI0027B0A2D2|nr:SpoIIIAH-like family protein [Herbivorax sp. ANBcel31]MDQ2085306.1 SpoIIIAH-like family protein [Herbivorax sp. ANBcel31]